MFAVEDGQGGVLRTDGAVVTAFLVEHFGKTVRLWPTQGQAPVADLDPTVREVVDGTFLRGRAPVMSLGSRMNITRSYWTVSD